MKFEEILYDAIINKIKIDINGKKYVDEVDVVKMCDTLSEQATIERILNKKGIKVKRQEVKKTDRPRLVRQYEYGKYEGQPEEYRDKPVYAVIDYNDNGDVIYENYDKLVEFLEDEFIPNHITYKKKKKSEDKSGKLYPFIQLNMLVSLRLSDREMTFALDYLNNLGIMVRGKDSSIDQDFENYDYYVTYKNFPLPKSLTPFETYSKIIEYKATEDKAIRDEIIKGNLKLARWIAFKYAMFYQANVDELSSYAYEGLVYAVEHFDIKGINFSTYAFSIISGYVKNGYREMTYNKKDEWIENFLRAKRTVEKMSGVTLEEEPNLIYDINELMIVQHRSYDSKWNLNKINIFVREMMYDIEDLVEQENDILIDNEQFIDDKKLFMAEDIRKILNTLSDRERKVILLIFGLENSEPKTLEEVAKIFGISRTMVAHIRDSALAKLRTIQNRKKLVDYYK